MRTIIRLAYVFWLNIKKHLSVEEYLRWMRWAYPPGVDAPSEVLLRAHPELVDIMHAVNYRAL